MHVQTSVDLNFDAQSLLPTCRADTRLDIQDHFDNTGNMETNDAVSALSALAQETRLSVFRLLVEAGPSGLPVGQIASRLGIPNATLSFHLKELAAADLMVTTPAGRSILCSANFTTMNALLGYLTENCCAGESCSSTQPCAPTGASASAKGTSL